MKVFKLESLRTKILLAVFAVLLPAFTLTLYVFTYETSQMQEAAALQYAQALAKENAAHVQASLEVALQTARTLAAALKGMKTHGHASRAEANAILQSAAEANPRLLGTWTIWEPDAFDGRDQQSIGQPGTDPKGRFAPYWNRGHGQVRVEPIHDFETPGLGDFYLIPKHTGRETIVEPYSYNISGTVILMTSLVVPINVQGQFAGVAGVDIPLAAFQEMVSHIRLMAPVMPACCHMAAAISPPRMHNRSAIGWPQRRRPGRNWLLSVPAKSIRTMNSGRSWAKSSAFMCPSASDKPARPGPLPLPSRCGRYWWMSGVSGILP